MWVGICTCIYHIFYMEKGSKAERQKSTLRLAFLLTMAFVTAVLFIGFTSLTHCFVQISHTLTDPSSDPDT